jgi:hypothetical protein
MRDFAKNQWMSRFNGSLNCSVSVCPSAITGFSMYWFLRTPIAAEACELCGVFEACNASWVLAGTCASLAFDLDAALEALALSPIPVLGAIPPKCPAFSQQATRLWDYPADSGTFHISARSHKREKELQTMFLKMKEKKHN